MGNLALPYPTLGVLAVAGVVFIRGYQAYRHGNCSAGVLWWLVSALMLFVYALGAAFMRNWVSVAIVFVFLVVDAGWIMLRLEDRDG
jgi:hypothetical protein